MARCLLLALYKWHTVVQTSCLKTLKSWQLLAQRHWRILTTWRSFYKCIIYFIIILYSLEIFATSATTISNCIGPNPSSPQCTLMYSGSVLEYKIYEVVLSIHFFEHRLLKPEQWEWDQLYFTSTLHVLMFHKKLLLLMIKSGRSSITKGKSSEKIKYVQYTCKYTVICQNEI